MQCKHLASVVSPASSKQIRENLHCPYLLTSGLKVCLRLHVHASTRSFALTALRALQPPKFEFYDPQSPIYTSPRFLPPAKIVSSKITDAIISHGAFLEECDVENAIVGLRSRVGKNAKIEVCSAALSSLGTNFVCLDPC